MGKSISLTQAADGVLLHFSRVRCERSLLCYNMILCNSSMALAGELFVIGRDNGDCNGNERRMTTNNGRQATSLS